MYSIFLAILNKKEKKKNLRAVIYCTSLSDVLGCIPLLPLCFIVNICLTDVRGGMKGGEWGGGVGGVFATSDILQVDIQMHRHWCSSQSYKEMMKMYSLQGYDEVPRRQLGASVFSVALSWMCFMYFTSFYTLIRKCSRFLKQQKVHCLCDNWSCVLKEKGQM